MSAERLEPKFVKYLPAVLDDGILYISLEYATASHLCVCGCGDRVVTPLGTADWILTFDGTVTLSPSVGNGQLACRSHYLIRRNDVRWCRPMTRWAAQVVHTADTVQRTKTYGDSAGVPVLVRARRWVQGVLSRF